MPANRICSLLPSATEIVYALGLGDRLVAVTHECDFPPEVATKPQVTTSVIDSEGMTSREIDSAVRESLAGLSTIYHLNGKLLDELQPDLVLTQQLCTVCAVGTDEVRETVEQLQLEPRVVSLEPTTLGGVLDNILTVGRLTGTFRRALEVVESLRARLEAIREVTAALPAVPVLTLEWLDPPFVGGHWVPEMVEIAGGEDVLGLAGEPSREVSWSQIADTSPEAVVLMPCGFGLARTLEEVERVSFPEEWQTLRAVRSGRVYAVDGSSYFNRPGPRLIDGVEILASILHLEAFPPAPDGRSAPVTAAQVTG